MFLARGFAVWIVIIMAEITNGILRGLFIVPVTGDFTARQIGVFTGSLIIFAISVIFIKWIRALTAGNTMAVGLMWLLLTMAFETGFGRFVVHLSWERILEDFNIINGGLLSLGMLFLVFAPFLAAKVRKVI